MDGAYWLCAGMTLKTLCSDVETWDCTLLPKVDGYLPAPTIELISDTGDAIPLVQVERPVNRVLVCPSTRYRNIMC